MYRGILGVAAGVAAINRHIQQTVLEQSQPSSGPVVVSDDQAGVFIQSFFELLSMQAPPLTSADILSALSESGYSFANTSYAYISFVKLNTLDDININVKTSYIPGYNNGKVYFYQTQLTQSELEWTLQASTSQIYTLSGASEAKTALILAVKEN